MGLLDDLRKKSSELQEQERQIQAEQERSMQFYREYILPSLKQIYNQLSELSQHLNYLQQELKVNYVVSSDGLTHEFQQQDYQLEIDSTEHTRMITLRFKCLGPRPISYHIANGDQLPKHLDYLNRYNLTYSCRPCKNDRHKIVSANIEIKAYIPVTFVFEADVENSLIKLHISNFEGLGYQSYNIYLDNISEQFYESIGRYIIREDVNFLKLDISDQEKNDIRQMVASEIEQRHSELGYTIRKSRQLQQQHGTRHGDNKRKSSQ